VLPETESDAEGHIRDMFLISAFEEIQIPINSVYGARVWDIVERFAKHRTRHPPPPPQLSDLATHLIHPLPRTTWPVSGALKTMDDEEEENRKDNVRFIFFVMCAMCDWRVGPT
jgi:hypothetical protein